MARLWHSAPAMMTTVSVSELRATIHLTTDEAVAIVQQLLQGIRSIQGPPSLLVAPPSAESVYLSRDGSVGCRSVHATPSVFEIAILLQSLLPPGTMARGCVRHTIARALLEVDIPPFDSIQEFSRALARFEQFDRGDLIRGVVDRWQRSMPAPSLAAVPAVESRVQTPAKRFRIVPAFGACVAAGGMLIAAAEFMQLRRGVDLALPAAAPPPALSANLVRSSGLQWPEPPAVAMQSAARRDVWKRPAKLVRSAESRSDRTDATRRGRRGLSRSVLEKLRLQWLKKAFSLHPDPC